MHHRAHAFRQYPRENFVVCVQQRYRSVVPRVLSVALFVQHRDVALEEMFGDFPGAPRFVHHRAEGLCEDRGHAFVDRVRYPVRSRLLPYREVFHRVQALLYGNRCIESLSSLFQYALLP